MKQTAFPKKKYYLIFTLYFLVFGVVIALITSMINYKANFTDIDNKLQHLATSESEFKRNVLFDYISSVDMMLAAITENDLTHKYIKSGTSADKQNLKNLFYALAYANKDIMQLRYIDASGQELIRIDRDKRSHELLMVAEASLQNKSNRYYFKEASQLMSHQFWHSNIDLNMERGEIEVPFKPTFRVATGLLVDNQLKGIIIVNLLFENMINILANSSNFNIYVVDKEGEIIHSPNRSESWSRYLEHKSNLQTIFPDKVNLIRNRSTYSTQGLYSFSYGDLFKNTENLKIIFTPKSDALEKIHEKNIFTALIIAVTVILVSVPLSWLISIVPSSLQSKLAEAYERISKDAAIIDNYVMISTTDREGRITDVSSCFTDITGYTASEIIGKRHSVLRHPGTSPATYKELWKTVLNGQMWEGDLQDLDKSGHAFWVHVVITPEINLEGEIDRITAISQDITDKKNSEEMAATDNLTGLYNRVRLNDILLTEISRYERYENQFSVIFMDIDFFKKINDTYGHSAGDAVLVQLAKILKDNVRDTDYVSRWGGEEFLIVVSGLDSDSAFILAEKLRLKIANEEFVTNEQVTISCGVAQYKRGEVASDFIARADSALYEAKKSGRNRVIKN